MDTDQEAMIECEGLTKRFGTFTAVDHVSFSVGKGSIFGFLGPNGSGKSTVIRMLCGILEPSDGTARIGGHDIIQKGEEIKEMIGYMSQKFSLYDELTVNENLIFAGKLYGLNGRDLEKRRDEMIAITHLEPYINRRAALLSDRSDGTARIGGHDIIQKGEEIKEMIGYMSQKFSLYDELTVNENLIFAGKLYGLNGRDLEKRRDEMIAITHLEPYINRRAALL